MFTHIFPSAHVTTGVPDLVITLPSSPSVNDRISISDYNASFEDYNLTIARNGKKIVGIEEDFVCDMNNLSLTFVYTGTTQGWRIV